MSEDIDYIVRPREMCGAQGKWTRDEKRRRATHDGDRARSASRKLVHRGLNRDTSGPALSRAIGEACAPLDRNSYDAMRRLTLALDAMGSGLVSVGGGPQALARLARFHRAWIRTPRTWSMVASQISSAAPRGNPPAKTDSCAKRSRDGSSCRS